MSDKVTIKYMIVWPEFWSEFLKNNLRIMQLFSIRKDDICQQARHFIRISIANPDGEIVIWLMEYFKNFYQNCTCGQPIRWQQNYYGFLSERFCEFEWICCANMCAKQSHYAFNLFWGPKDFNMTIKQQLDILKSMQNKV